MHELAPALHGAALPLRVRCCLSTGQSLDPMAFEERGQLGRRDDRTLADFAGRNFASGDQLVNSRARKVERIGGIVYSVRETGRQGCRRAVRFMRDGGDFGFGHDGIHLIFNGRRYTMLGWSVVRMYIEDLLEA